MQTDLFRTLNQFVEPLVRAGVGSPGPWPTGVIVLETRGRKSGRTLSVPLLATLIGDLVLVGTLRRPSQWVSNIAHTPHVRYWMNGRAREATALVVAPGVERPATMSPVVDCLVAGLAPFGHWFGITFAILGPLAPVS